MSRYISLAILAIFSISFARVNPETIISPDRNGNCTEGQFLDCSGNCIDDRALAEGWHLDDVCDNGGDTQMLTLDVRSLVLMVVLVMTVMVNLTV